MGPVPTAQVLVSLHHLGRLNSGDAAEAARWLRAQQRTDGSFLPYPYAKEGDPGATACAWAALHVTGQQANADAIARARAWLDRHGGVDRVIAGMDRGDLSAVYLALAGLVDASKLPCPSMFFSLVPPLVRFLEGRFHSGILMVALQLGVLIRKLRGDWGPDGRKKGFIAQAECRRCIELLETFQNQDGSWNANTLQQSLALPALIAAGVSIHDPRIIRGLSWLESQKVRDASGLRYHAFGSAVWSTAFDARALLSTGVPANDPAIQRALRWLIDAQLDVPQPEVDNRNPGAPRTGGWGFQKGNHTMADCDDAGVVFSAFGMALAHRGAGALEDGLARRVRSSSEKGKAWLYGMQNPDGGWSAFVWGLPGKKPGPAMEKTPAVKLDDVLAMARLMIDTPPELGDPSTEDVTARILHGLGKLGYTVHAPEVQRAVEFLRKQQCEFGPWWGRWVVNYLSATSFVLMGLAAVGVDMREEWVRRAVRWVLARQNPDGGWGETADSYANPELGGIGPSMAPLTGLVLQGLIDAGEGDSPAVARGIEWLLKQQRADGTWPNGEYLHANIPPDTFYAYSEAARFYPTEALGRYLEHRRQLPDPLPPPRWSDALLDEMRQRTDPTADSVVEQLFTQGSIGAVNEVLGKLFRSDEPMPQGLPEVVRVYFDDTAALPSWTDPAKIATAQKLFTRAGWQVAMGLFCSSLPQAYAAAKGARVLVQTGEMTRHVRQRIFETAQFLFDVLDEGGLEPAARGIRTVQKIRLMHAGIRHLLITREQPRWDAEHLGKPINQEDLAGTLMTFSVVTLDAIQRLGISVSGEEREAWLHLWRVVGHLLGIHEELLPRDAADGEALMDAIRLRQWAPSEEGRQLTRALVELMQERYFPGTALDGVPVALIRYLAGDHCGDLLGLPSTDDARLLIEASEIIESLVELGDRELGLSRLFAEATNLLMKAFVQVEREGKQVGFRIPQSLQDALGLGR